MEKKSQNQKVKVCVSRVGEGLGYSKYTLCINIADWTSNTWLKSSAYILNADSWCCTCCTLLGLFQYWPVSHGCKRVQRLVFQQSGCDAMIVYRWQIDCVYIVRFLPKRAIRGCSTSHTHSLRVSFVAHSWEAKTFYTQEHSDQLSTNSCFCTVPLASSPSREWQFVTE